MNDCTPTNMRDPANGSKLAPSYGSFLSRAIWIVTSATLVIFLIFLSIGHYRLSQIGTQIFSSICLLRSHRHAFHLLSSLEFPFSIPVDSRD